MKLRDLNSNALIWYISVLLNFFWECCSILARGSLHNSGRRWGINQTWATNTCSSFSVINRIFPASSGKDKFRDFSFAFSSPFFFSASVQFSFNPQYYLPFSSPFLSGLIFFGQIFFFSPSKSRREFRWEYNFSARVLGITSKKSFWPNVFSVFWQIRPTGLGMGGPVPAS